MTLMTILIMKYRKKYKRKTKNSTALICTLVKGDIFNDAESLSLYSQEHFHVIAKCNDGNGEFPMAHLIKVLHVACISLSSFGIKKLLHSY